MIAASAPPFPMSLVYPEMDPVLLAREDRDPAFAVPPMNSPGHPPMNSPGHPPMHPWQAYLRRVLSARTIEADWPEDDYRFAAD